MALAGHGCSGPREGSYSLTVPPTFIIGSLEGPRKGARTHLGHVVYSMWEGRGDPGYDTEYRRASPSPIYPTDLYRRPPLPDRPGCP